MEGYGEVNWISISVFRPCLNNSALEVSIPHLSQMDVYYLSSCINIADWTIHNVAVVESSFIVQFQMWKLNSPFSDLSLFIQYY